MNRMAERNKKIAGSKLKLSPGAEEALAWAAQPAVGDLVDALEENLKSHGAHRRGPRATQKGVLDQNVESAPKLVLLIGVPSAGKQHWIEQNKDKIPANPIDIDPGRDTSVWYSEEREVEYARKERWINGDLQDRNDFSINMTTFSTRAAGVVTRATQQGFAVSAYLVGSSDTDQEIPKVTQQLDERNLGRHAHMLQTLDIFDATGKTTTQVASLAAGQERERQPAAPAWTKRLIQEIAKGQAIVHDRGR